MPESFRKSLSTLGSPVVAKGVVTTPVLVRHLTQEADRFLQMPEMLGTETLIDEDRVRDGGLRGGGHWDGHVCGG